MRGSPTGWKHTGGDHRMCLHPCVAKTKPVTKPLIEWVDVYNQQHTSGVFSSPAGRHTTAFTGVLISLIKHLQDTPRRQHASKSPEKDELTSVSAGLRSAETLQPLWAMEQGEAGISFPESKTQHNCNLCVGFFTARAVSANHIFYWRATIMTRLGAQSSQSSRGTAARWGWWHFLNNKTQEVRNASLVKHTQKTHSRGSFSPYSASRHLQIFVNGREFCEDLKMIWETTHSSGYLKLVSWSPAKEAIA